MTLFKLFSRKKSTKGTDNFKKPDQEGSELKSSQAAIQSTNVEESQLTEDERKELLASSKAYEDLGVGYTIG
ncbi:hypothetical protein [Legionella fairfieldensis]|uniref:hypothetical protein n=1 Tax=Legionella fairfieldensis TaxID=45064 RepID=UPI0004919BDE|nr:hypothetical protein [Legionella fairfieldensis]